MSSRDWLKLRTAAEALAAETLAAEQELLERPELQLELGMPRRLERVLQSARPTPSAGRVMCFDFHWTRVGW